MVEEVFLPGLAELGRLHGIVERLRDFGFSETIEAKVRAKAGEASQIQDAPKPVSEPKCYRCTHQIEDHDFESRILYCKHGYFRYEECNNSIQGCVPNPPACEGRLFQLDTRRTHRI